MKSNIAHLYSAFVSFNALRAFKKSYWHHSNLEHTCCTFIKYAHRWVSRRVQLCTSTLCTTSSNTRCRVPNTCKNYQIFFFFFFRNLYPLYRRSQSQHPPLLMRYLFYYIVYKHLLCVSLHGKKKKKKESTFYSLKNCDTRAKQAFQWSLRVTFSELFDYMFRILCSDAFRVSLKWSAYLESGATHLRIIGQALDSACSEFF